MRDSSILRLPYGSLEFAVAVPKDKADMAAVTALRATPRADLVPLIPELLTWLADMNWPVARPISEILSGFGLELVEPIREILKSNDEVWKYWIVYFLADTGPEVFASLEPDVRRVAERPTNEEVSEEVDLAARTVLRSLSSSVIG